ncbi:hypothetical protein AGMMS49942_14810 [Spirochaetia bacterium]|nr:hypothetical protein AGMMS49942_14810 [Spirochaetia bacterium]
MEQKNSYIGLDDILRSIRNNVVKIITESSPLYSPIAEKEFLDIDTYKKDGIRIGSIKFMRYELKSSLYLMRMLSFIVILGGLNFSLYAQSQSTNYYILVNDKQTGPYTLEVLSQMVQSGTLAKDSLVWKTGMAEWSEAETVSEINALFVPKPRENVPERNISNLEQRINVLEQSANVPEQSISDLEQRINALERSANAPEQSINDLEQRVNDLERSAKAPERSTKAPNQSTNVPEQRVRGAMVMGTLGGGYSFVSAGSSSGSATSISLDINLITKYGLQLSFMEIANFKIGGFASHNPAVGIGYSANQLERWTFEGSFMCLFDVDHLYIGPKAGVTVWFVPEIGISLLGNYAYSIADEVSFANIRIGLSLRAW